MNKLRSEGFAIQVKNRLDLNVFVCLQKRTVGKLSAFIRNIKVTVSPVTDRESIVSTKQKVAKGNSKLKVTGLCADTSQLCLYIQITAFFIGL